MGILKNNQFKRRRIFEVIEVAEARDRISQLYDGFMIIMIIISLMPLTMKNPNVIWVIIDKICVSIFIIDYFLRLLTADYKLEEKGAAAFVKYPFSTMAVLDLLSILPSLLPVNRGLKVLRVFRMGRAFRVFRVLRALRYSKNLKIIVAVMRKSKDSLIAVCFLAGAYILISALIIFNVEPASFNTFFDAIYWATVSLTTVGYGDIYPVTTVGRIITMISSVFGFAVVALPAGIITAGYMSEIDEKKDEDDKKNEDE